MNRIFNLLNSFKKNEKDVDIKSHMGLLYHSNSKIVKDTCLGHELTIVKPIQNQTNPTWMMTMGSQ